MDREKLIDKLLIYFLNARGSTSELEIPSEYSMKRKLLRTLMNIRAPKPLEPSIQKLQDQLLKEECRGKYIVDPYNLPVIFDQFRMDGNALYKKLVLWKGDITSISADAIVNAANTKLLGCFIPLHTCIDNAIHSAAGVQLRTECDEIMRNQNFDEPTGHAKITQGYNLPCKYVLHTVGPIIDDDLREEDCHLLKKSYISCLEKATEYDDIKTIAFCCISTGEFKFPKDVAATLAFETVMNWLSHNPDRYDRIIFNVFTEEDYHEYSKLFIQS